MGSLWNINYPDPKFWSKTSLIQLGYGFWISLPFTAIGMAFGISQVLQAKFDMIWIGDSMTLIVPITAILSGYTIDRFGRRKTMICSEIPLMLGLLSVAGDSYSAVMIGRIVTGIGSGLSLVAPRVYATELTLPNMRPLVSSIPNIAFSIGLMIQHCTEDYMDLSMFSYTISGMTFLITLSLLFLPESPYYVLMTDTQGNTKKCLQRYRSKNYLIDAEMDELNEFKSNNSIRRLTIVETSKAVISSNAFGPLFIVLAYVFLAQMSGVAIIKNSFINEKEKRLIVDTLRVFFGMVSAGLLFKYSYRIISMASGVGIVLSCFTLGTLLLYLPKDAIIPQVFYCLHIIAETIGYFSLPAALMGELYPLQIRGMLCGIAISLFSFMGFFSRKLHGFLKQHLGLASTLYYHGSIALIGCVVLYFILPNTFNLTLQEIEEYYNETRPTLVSQRKQMATQLNKYYRNRSLVKRKKGHRDILRKYAVDSMTSTSSRQKT